jgi:hypothetical protein
MNKLTIAFAGLALLSACSQPAQQSKEAAISNNAAAPAPAPQAMPPSVNQPVANEPAANAPAAVPQSPETQPPTIDPKSSAAAEALVRGFVDLLNQGKLNEAYMLLGSAAPPRSQFDQHFDALTGLHVSMGNAGDQEGAAGSIYLSVPLTVSGMRNGKTITRSATTILRRVNDVPGSTEAQRHWHIERIDWSGAA